MTIREVTMYKVVCNGCGTDAEEDTDYYAWVECAQAEDQAREADWLIRDGDHWCPGCTVYDGERDEYVPKTADSAAGMSPGA